jgi:hypothetical protein
VVLSPAVVKFLIYLFGFAFALLYFVPVTLAVSFKQCQSDLCRQNPKGVVVVVAGVAVETRPLVTTHTLMAEAAEIMVETMGKLPATAAVEEA